MTASSLRTPDVCLKRAITFKEDAEALKAISSQWFAVSYFYAAYHIVRASLMEDPIFQDVARLKTVNENWLPEDRFNDHHKARRGSGHVGPPGVHDMVIAFYNDISIEYARLHSASIAVRYGVGLEGYDSEVLTADFLAIAKAATAGELLAP